MYYQIIAHLNDLPLPVLELPGGEEIYPSGLVFALCVPLVLAGIYLMVRSIRTLGSPGWRLLGCGVALALLGAWPTGLLLGSLTADYLG